VLTNLFDLGSVRYNNYTDGGFAYAGHVNGFNDNLKIVVDVGGGGYHIPVEFWIVDGVNGFVNTVFGGFDEYEYKFDWSTYYSAPWYISAGINNKNEVIGQVLYSSSIGPTKGNILKRIFWIWDSVGGMRDIASLIAGWNIEEVIDINDLGQILAKASRTGYTGAILLTPIPELSQFGFSGIPAEIPVSQFFPVTITAQDSNGTTVSSFSGKIYLNTSVGRVYPTEVTLNNGTVTVQLKLDSPGMGIQLFVNGNGMTGQSTSFNVTGTQTGTSISGKVRDSSGAVMDKAEIYLWPQANNRPADLSPVAVTDSSGRYQIQGITPGVYQASAKWNGTESRIADWVTVYASVPTTLDFTIPGSTCNSGSTMKTPILLVPGIMGSSTGDGGLYPTLTDKFALSWNSSKWRNNGTYGLHDPKLFGDRVSGWMDLAETLTDGGYQWDCTLFAVPYDWTLPVQDIAQKYLIPAIEYAKTKAGTDKVTIIAHSMGGLVTRAYIQNRAGSSTYHNDIERFAIVGTPNHGAASAYYVWEGGDPELADSLNIPWRTNFVDRVIDNPHDFYKKTVNLLAEEISGRPLFMDICSSAGGMGIPFCAYPGYNPTKIQSFVRKNVKSMKQLMPTDPLLSDRSSNEYAPKKESNQWLIDLNKEYDYSIFKDKAIIACFFAGIDQDTIAKIKVGAPNELYTDGAPVGSPIYISRGDGTVLLTSLHRLSGYDQKEKAEQHASLVKTFKGQIADFVTGTSCAPVKQAMALTKSSVALTATLATAPSGNTLMLTVSGRLTPYLLDPQGRAVGFNPATQAREESIPGATVAMNGRAGTLTLSDLPTGIYTLSLQGEFQEDYQLRIDYLDPDQTIHREWRDFHRGGVEQVQFEIGGAGTDKLQVLRSPQSPDELRATPYQATAGLNTRLTWNPSSNAASYRIYSRRLDEPSLSLLATGTGTAYDTSDVWVDDDAKPQRLYAVSAVDSKGNESFLSVLETNNDRDHDNLSDAEESAFGGKMDQADTDSDGLNDGAERTRGTSLTNPDTDGDGFSDAQEVQKGSDPLDKDSIPNQAPTANAGPDQPATVGNPVTLNGSGTDPDSGPSPLTFAWSQTGGPAVTLTGATTATPSFKPTQTGNYTFQLVVNDGKDGSASDSVIVKMGAAPVPNQPPTTNTNPNQTPGAGNTPSVNQPPIAQAGPDQTVSLGAKVSLDGSGSADPDQGPAPLAYAWVQTEGPSIALDNAASMAPSFTPAAPGTYTFNLTVSDGAATSPVDTVSVTVGDVPILVLSPNGGEIWKARTVQALQWYVSGTLANTGKPVTIRFSKNGGKKWKKLKKVSAAANSFQWRPKRADRSTQARIQICLAPVGKKAKPVCDASGGNFTIQK
jgi:pimeloyl-ACP methyl ester carboxylesterase